MTQDGVLDDEVLATAGHVRGCAGSERGSGWLGDFFDLVFDTIEEGFAGINDSSPHDLFSIFERVKDGE